MDRTTFIRYFPAFPIDNDSLEKLYNILTKDNFVEVKVWEELENKCSTPQAFVELLTTLKQVTAEVLAKAEAEIRGVPYVNVAELQVNSDAFKMLPDSFIKKHQVLPVNITGAELVVAMADPTDLGIFDNLKINLAIKPAKGLANDIESKINQTLGVKSGAKKGQRKRLGDIILELGYCSKEVLDEGFKKAKDEKLRIGAYLVKHNHLNNKQLSIALSKQYDIPYIDLEESLVDPVVASLLPKKLCYDHIICPVKRENNKLIIAMHDPTDIITIDHIEMMCGMRVSPVVSSELSIMAALDVLFGDSVDSLAEQIGGDEKAEDVTEDMNLSENDAPIIKLVNLILTQAVVMKVSDIHIEIYENEFRIRFRQDGSMKLFMTPAKAAHAALVSRIKVMSNLDIAETRRPQDGRIKLNMQNRKIDLRVSCLPCVWGEKIVMRICDQGNLKVDLNELGFEPFVLEKFNRGVESPNGIVLVTGPTGSGKTTTLYSALFKLNTPSSNIMTAEDPVEYNLFGINQVQCHADIGLDFGAALRSFLRQDPDVIMLGEIRDFETASIAIKAALTGHLVISTLHTNDAPATVARLLNMGIEPFSLSSSLRVVQAQRLVRRVCKECAEEYKPDESLLKSLDINERTLKKLHLDDQFTVDNLVFKKGAGCETCNNTGLKGRQGIYEVLEVTNSFRELIENSATTEEMRRHALKEGMLSLRESALYKLITGRTTVSEVVETTVDAGGKGDDEDEKKKPKMAESSSDAAVAKLKKAEEEKAAAAAAIQNQTIVIGGGNDGLSGLTAELHEFNSLISKMSSSSPKGAEQAMSLMNNEALRAGIVTPLETIRAYASKTDQADKVLPVIRAQGQKMEHNIRNLVSHFTEYSPKLSKVQLNQLVERDVIASLKNYILTARLISGIKGIGTNVKISKNLQANLPPVKVDSNAFSTIASNLVINSLVGLGEKGGEIKVVTRLNPKNPNMVELVIFDSGSGIPVETQKHLFEPFTGKQTLGLGLPVVKKLLTELGGSIDIKSTAGKTLVTVGLPIVK